MLSPSREASGWVFDRAAVGECIEACFDCAQACLRCADACLSEDRPAELRQCIRFDLDCADVCMATAKILTRASRKDGDGRHPLGLRMLEVCAAYCRGCAEECARHAGRHAHCRDCAEACRACEDACLEALRAA